MYVSESSIHKNKAFGFSNFGHFLSHFLSIWLIRGSTYTRVYTVVVLMFFWRMLADKEIVPKIRIYFRRTKPSTYNYTAITFSTNPWRVNLTDSIKAFTRLVFHHRKTSFSLSFDDEGTKKIVNFVFCLILVTRIRYCNFIGLWWSGSRPFSLERADGARCRNGKLQLDRARRERWIQSMQFWSKMLLKCFLTLLN